MFIKLYSTTVTRKPFDYSYSFKIHFLVKLPGGGEWVKFIYNDISTSPPSLKEEVVTSIKTH